MSPTSAAGELVLASLVRIEAALADMSAKVNAMSGHGASITSIDERLRLLEIDVGKNAGRINTLLSVGAACWLPIAGLLIHRLVTGHWITGN